MPQTDPYGNYQGKGYKKPDPQFIQYNPPVNRFVSGAYTADSNNKDRTADSSDDPTIGRNQILGPDSFSVRRYNKGILYQDFGTASTGNADPFENQNTNYTGFKTLGDNRYGFKFHYNPSLIEFGINYTGNTIDPGLILAGKTRAMPIAPPSGLPTVSFSLIINRIEDVAMLSNGGYGRENMEYYYGRKLTTAEVDGLVTRGSGYDLEFLFRTLLGRPYQTDLRGETADIGIVFGLPLILDFSPRNIREYSQSGSSATGQFSGIDSAVPTGQHGQRYWGRVSNISYTHREFNREMVPMFTEVYITFNRYPDAKGELYEAGSDRARDGILAAKDQGVDYVRMGPPLNPVQKPSGIARGPGTPMPPHSAEEIP